MNVKRLGLVLLLAASPALAKPKKPARALPPAVEAGLTTLAADTAAATYSGSMSAGLQETFHQQVTRPSACVLHVVLESEYRHFDADVALQGVSAEELKPSHSVPEEIVGHLAFDPVPWCVNMVFGDKIPMHKWIRADGPVSSDDYPVFYMHLCYPNPDTAARSGEAIKAAVAACNK